MFYQYRFVCGFLELAVAFYDSQSYFTLYLSFFTAVADKTR